MYLLREYYIYLLKYLSTRQELIDPTTIFVYKSLDQQRILKCDLVYPCGTMVLLAFRQGHFFVTL